jgi:hypothetical protein
MVGMAIKRRYRCRFCGARLPVWLPAAQEPNGALLLGHLSQHHRDRVKAFVDRMRTTEDITLVAAEAFEVVKDREAEKT